VLGRFSLCEKRATLTRLTEIAFKPFRTVIEPFRIHVVEPFTMTTRTPGRGDPGCGMQPVEPVVVWGPHRSRRPEGCDHSGRLVVRGTDVLPNVVDERVTVRDQRTGKSVGGFADEKL